MKIDLNCDVGEGCGNDAELLSIVTSANIACGYHAGDTDSMKRTVIIAIENDVAIGAHPGYPDREGFGRRPRDLGRSEIEGLITDQLASLAKIADESGGRISHIKPHGALYNQAARDQELANAIAEAVRSFDKDLILVGLSNSELTRAGVTAGLTVAEEVFADRTYRRDGRLTPRSMPNSLITDTATATTQVLRMISEHCVISLDGTAIPITADTVCIHGDGERAVEFARAIRRVLKQNAIEIRPFSTR